MKNYLNFLMLILISALNGQTEVTYKDMGDYRVKVLINFQLDSSDCLYHDYLTVSSNNPSIKLEWTVNQKVRELFDTDFEEVKKVYVGNPIIEIIAISDQPSDGTVHVDYYQKSNKKIDVLSIPIHIHKSGQRDKLEIESQLTNNVAQQDQKSNVINENPPKEEVVNASWSEYIESLLNKAESLWIRILFALLLGLLLSLTPCVYPMIPITVGILQTQGSRSILRNFLMALSYTIGIATTYALLGLSAAFTGQIFGSLLSQPFFVFSIVALLLYLAGSMIGFYDMYIPSFLMNGNQIRGNGSLISAFLFGSIAGTIASPCLSPGLVLLLTLVTAIGNKVIGFLLLFAFGVGLSIPLLIIGTFSSSLSILPSAGLWMVEVKKMFGFIMIGMCLFYLKNVVAWSILSWVIATTVLITGAFYLYQATIVPGWRRIYNMLGTIIIAFSMFLFFKSYQTLYPEYVTSKEEKSLQWYTDYQEALQVGRDHNKLLFVKIGAPYCSQCKVLDKALFAHDDVKDVVAKQFVPFIIDNVTDNSEHKNLQREWNVRGVPVFFIIDPRTAKRVHRFGPELADWPRSKFITELKKLRMS